MSNENRDYLRDCLKVSVPSRGADMSNLYGVWEREKVGGRVASILWELFCKSGRPEISSLDVRDYNYEQMMMHPRRHKKSCGRRDYPYTMTDEPCHRGYTDESHWVGVVGSMVGNSLRYSESMKYL